MSTKRLILVVDDERDLANLITYNLRKAGYLTTLIGPGSAALDLIAQNQPDLVILDTLLLARVEAVLCRIDRWAAEARSLVPKSICICSDRHGAWADGEALRHWRAWG